MQRPTRRLSGCSRRRSSPALARPDHQEWSRPSAATAVAAAAAADWRRQSGRSPREVSYPRVILAPAVLRGRLHQPLTLRDPRGGGRALLPPATAWQALCRRQARLRARANSPGRALCRRLPGLAFCRRPSSTSSSSSSRCVGARAAWTLPPAMVLPIVARRCEAQSRRRPGRPEALITGLSQLASRRPSNRPGCQP